MSIALISELTKNIKQGVDVNAAMMKLKSEAAKSSAKSDAKKASIADEMKKKQKTEKIDEKMQMLVFTSLLITLISKSLARKPFSFESTIGDVGSSLQILKANKSVITQIAAIAASDPNADAWVSKTEAAMAVLVNQLSAAATGLASAGDTIAKGTLRV